MNTPDLSTLTPETRELLLREIDPEESLLWVGRPDVDAWVRSKRRESVVIVSCFLVWIPLLLVFPFVELRFGQPPKHSVGNYFSHNSVILSMFFALTAFVFWFFGNRIPRWTRRRADRMAYAITNERAVTLELTADRQLFLNSVEPGSPLVISRREIAPNVGHLFFYAVEQRLNVVFPPRFLFVKNPRSVESLIRQTFVDCAPPSDTSAVDSRS